MILGQATAAQTSQFLKNRFHCWKYQDAWQVSLVHNQLVSSRLGIEFTTSDLPQIQENFEQLLSMGCNHFQWKIEQSEELAFVRHPPFLAYFQNPNQALASREGVIFSLKLASQPMDKIAHTVELASTHMAMAHWDRILIQLSETQLSQELLLSFPSVGAFQEAPFIAAPTIDLHQLALSPSQVFSLLEESTDSSSSLVSFLNQMTGAVSLCPTLPSLETVTVISSKENDALIETQQQTYQTLLALLQAKEKKINSDLVKWVDVNHPSIDLKPFNFFRRLKDACETIQDTERWEYYLSNLWFPAFQHHVQSWSFYIPEAYQEQWRWNIREFMDQIHDIMGVYSKLLRLKQTQRLWPLSERLEQILPQFPIVLTFGAKLLFFLASAPWSETIFFPWKTLDSAFEYLGLMRFPFREHQ